MRSWILLSVLSVGVLPTAGCGMGPAREFEERLPASESLLLDFPGVSSARSTSTGDTLEQAFQPTSLPALALVPVEEPSAEDSAACYDGTLELSTRANATVAYVLNGLDTITDYRPQQVEQGVYEWGPWTSENGQLDLRLRMSEDEEGGYVYSFQGSQTGQETFLQLIFGVLEAGSTREAGTGSFVIDYDNLETLEATSARSGQAAFNYAYDGTGARDIRVQLTDFTFDNGERSDAILEFSREAEGSGVLDWSRSRDGYDDGTGEALQESYVYRSRWLADKSGRCDGTISGGDLGAHEVRSHQCWDSSTAEVYYLSELDGVEVKLRGSVESCVFADASYAD